MPIFYHFRADVWYYRDMENREQLNRLEWDRAHWIYCREDDRLDAATMARRDVLDVAITELHYELAAADPSHVIPASVRRS